MKLFIEAGLAAAMTMGLGPTRLCAQSPLQFGLGGGASIPLGAFGRGLNTGWHALALVEVHPGSGHVGLRVDAALHRLSFEGGGGNTQVLNATANAVYQITTSPGTQLRPYLFGGGGVYRFKINSDLEAPAPQTKLGLNVGVGAKFEGLGGEVFIEARFHNVSVPGSDFRFLPITAGLRFGGRSARDGS